MLQKKKSESKYFSIWLGICSTVPLAVVIFLNTKLFVKLLSTRGFFSPHTIANIHSYQYFLLILSLSLIAIIFALYKLQVFDRMSDRFKTFISAIYLPLIFLIIFESGGRIALDIKGNAHDLYIDHPYLIVVPKPNERLGKISINSLGYRGPEISLSKSDNLFRIVCLGGSATFCDNVSDANTWCQQLENILNKNTTTNYHFEVVNAGVPGYTTAESLINFNLRILNIDPDLIIIYHSYNDFKPNRFPGFKRDYSHWRRSFGKVKKSSISQVFVTPQVFSKVSQKLFPSKSFGYKRHDTVDQSGLKAYRQNLSNIVLLAKSKGVDVILSSEASMLDKDTQHKFPQPFESAMKFVPTLSEIGLLDAQAKYDQVVKEVANSLNVAYVDNLKLVPKDFNNFIDHIHLTAKGCEVVANNFSNAVEKLLLSKNKNS